MSEESFLGRTIFEIDLFKRMLAQNSKSIQKMGHWEYDVKTGNAYWGPEMWEIYGIDYSPNQMVCIQNGLSIESWVNINQKMKRLIDDGVVYHDVYEYKRPNSKKVKIEAFSKRYIFEDGRVEVFGTAEIAQ
ncbi:MAG: hypothetical protein OHK0056_18460 [Bacteriovoracaceae bacterium]